MLNKSDVVKYAGLVLDRMRVNWPFFRGLLGIPDHVTVDDAYRIIKEAGRQIEENL